MIYYCSVSGSGKGYGGGDRWTMFTHVNSGQLIIIIIMKMYTDKGMTFDQLQLAENLAKW